MLPHACIIDGLSLPLPEHSLYMYLFVVSAEAATKKSTPRKQKAPETAPVEEPPADNTKYQCEIYLNHDAWSFYNTEAQMTARRVGQPSSKVKPTV